MKSTFISLILILAGDIIFGQSYDHTFTKHTSIRTPIQNDSEIPGLISTQKTEVVKYYDGIGRLQQEIMVQFTPNQKDMVKPVEYNRYGFNNRSFLPYAAENDDGTYKSDVLSEQHIFFLTASLVAHTQNPFAEVKYEQSPLLRILETSAPGYSWKMGNGHTSCNTYDFNSQTADGSIRKWTLRSDKTSCYSTVSDVYPDNSLIINESRDENASGTNQGTIIRRFLDDQGRTVMVQKVFTASKKHDTYYVYDDLDNLVIIIPAKAVAYMETHSWDTQSLPEDLIYRFKYDKRQRLIEKKVPGRSVINFVYDLLDRPILAQDGNLRDQSKWEYYKYDIYGRLIMTGIKTDNSNISQDQMQIAADGYVNNSTTFAYESKAVDQLSYPDGLTTTHSFPAVTPNESGSTPMTCYYYDTYPVDVTSGRYGFRTDNSIQTDPDYDHIKGLPTMQKCKKLDQQDPSWMNTLFFYDKYGRIIEMLSDNHLGGLDAVLYEYSFDGLLMKSLFIQNLIQPSQAYQTIRILETYEYDPKGRLVHQFHKINNQVPVMMTRLKYNELGQVVAKDLHSTDNGLRFLQSVDYRYNPRGWITNINRADLTNNNAYSQNEITLLTDELVAGMKLDSLTMNFKRVTDRDGKNIMEITMNDKKRLLINNSSNPANNRLQQNNEATTSVYYELKAEDSLSYSKFNPLHGNQLIFNFGELFFDEMDDPDELMDTIGRMAQTQLTRQGISDTNTRSMLTEIMQLFEKSRIGIVFFNKDHGDLFGMDILYTESIPQLNGAAQYNGNISGIRWQQAGHPGQRAYGFTYDNLNQLTDSRYAAHQSTGWTKDVGKYDEKGITYDENGNILTLERAGQCDPATLSYGPIDNLTYEYNGNQLKKVTDHVSGSDGRLGFADHANNTLEYAYDANGNLTRDDNKGIVSITYNYLNLPSEIKFDDGNKIDYLYDAFGNKLAKRVTTNTTNIQRWDYLPGSIYHTTNSGAPVLDMVATPQGKAVLNSLGIFDYQYFLTDHLGNVRVVFGDENDDGNPDIIQDDHYYPFGLRMYGLSTVSNIGNKFLYQAKELQPDEFTITINSKAVDTRLELYDFHARFYDPQLGRWHVPDPIINHANPYLAMLNSPAMVIDPDGMKPGWFKRLLRWIFGSGENSGSTGNTCSTGGEDKTRASNLGLFSQPANPYTGDGRDAQVSGGGGGGGGGGSSMENLNTVTNSLINQPSLCNTSKVASSTEASIYKKGVIENKLRSASIPGAGASFYFNREKPPTGEGYTIEINRIGESIDATIAEFIVYGPTPLVPLTGYILEPKGPSTTKRNKDQRIPAGIYNVAPFNGKVFQNVYIVYNMQVPKDRGILFHNGCFPKDTEGCFLLGSSFSIVDGNYSVWNSKATLNLFRNFLEKNMSILIIRDISIMNSFFER